MTNLLQIMQSSLKEYTFFPHQNKELMVRCRSLRGEHAALQLQVKEMGEENNRLKEGLREMESEKRYTPPPPCTLVFRLPLFFTSPKNGGIGA